MWGFHVNFGEARPQFQKKMLQKAQLLHPSKELVASKPVTLKDKLQTLNLQHSQKKIISTLCLAGSFMVVIPSPK